MITSLKPYSAMKNSGIEWLGDVPAHWEIFRLKGCVENIAEQTDTHSSDEMYIALENVESWTGRIQGVESDTAFDSQVKRFRPGDVLFGKLRPYLAKVTRPRKNGVCVSEFLVLRPTGKKLLPAYLEQLIRSKPTIDAINASTFGARMPRADWHFIGGMEQSLPPLPEQTAIVRYLDYADSRIQRFVRAKEKMIDLLNEQKRAIIHQVVTGQVDVRTGQPYPAYKPSGVGWLGEVPAHWVVLPLKHWVKMNTTVLPEKIDGEFEFNYLDIGSVGTGILLQKPQRLRFNAAPSRARRVVKNGDTIISTVRTYLKAVWYADNATYDLIASTGFAVLTPRQNTLPKFVSYLVQSNSFTDRVTAESVGTAYPAIAESRLGTFRVSLPPLPEQTAIVKHLDKTTADIDTAIARARREIELVNEYRTRLIADVVTGKLDVREAAAQLPDATEEPWHC